MTSSSEVLAARVAVVTGGASGIGLAIARRLLAAGALVHVCDASEATLKRAIETHEGLSGGVADVGSSADVAAFFEGVAARAGGVDILVNNAGVAGPRAPIETITDADWQRTISVNLNGLFYCARAAAPYMKRRGGGAIVNIATASVRTVPTQRSPYIASKAGVLGLTQALARELGPAGIRCNAILPGPVDNPRGRALVHSMAIEQGCDEAAAERDLLRFVSLRRWVSQDEIGALAVFLASDAGKNISGQEIGVCGNAEWEE